MKRSRTGSFAGEGHTSPPMATVQVPLPLLAVLQDTRTAFFGLCLDAGQQVLGTMMEEDREQLCGPKHVPNPERRAYRSGSTRGEVTLGGRRILVPRLRARSMEGDEGAPPSFTYAAGRAPLNAPPPLARPEKGGARARASELHLRPRPRSAQRPHPGGGRDRGHDPQVPPGAR